jgi:SET domain-containing protein
MEQGIGEGSCYLFRLDEDLIVDATVKGGKARFINHSCQPNCEAAVCEIDGHKHILLFAKRFIYRGEEIVYDYKFEVESEKIYCRCGQADCQGKLN